MDIITLAVQPREVGKRAARAARREGDVPCVLYGHHIEPVVFQVPEINLGPLIYTDEMHLVKVELEGNSWDCIIKDIDFHPVTDRPMHADFQVLQAGEKINISVPVRYVGTPPGQTAGGRVSYIVTELEVSCLPKNIPSHIDVDVSHVDIGDTVHLSDVQMEGIEFYASEDQILMTVLRPRAEIVDTEEEEVEGLLEGELEEGEEGETEEEE